MRHLCVLLLAAGLGSSTLGCSRTCRCTQGVCDCYPPPVETLLQPYCAPPTPQSPAIGVVPHGPAAPVILSPGTRIVPAPSPKGIEPIQTPPTPAPMPPAQ